MNVRVKICGITSPEEARVAVDAGADAIGLNFVPTSPRFVGDALSDVLRAIPPFVQVVGVFVDASVETIERLAPMLDLLQLHGREDPDDALWHSRPVLKAIRVRSGADLDQLPRWYGARGLLLDGAGRPGAFGGATFDWSLFERARAMTNQPLVLAGGLTPDNVADAIRATRPAGVDVASGVESSPGKKDPALLRAFIRAVREASGS